MIKRPLFLSFVCFGLFFLAGQITLLQADDLQQQEQGLHNRVAGLMGQFRYEDAEQLLVQLLKSNPDHLELKIDRAIALLNRQWDGDETRSLEIFQKLVQQYPKNLRANYLIGLLLLNAAQPQQAEIHFRRVQEDDPSDAHASYYLGLVQAQQFQWQAARGNYQRASELDPYMRSAYYGLFQVNRRLKKSTQARQALDLYQRLATNPRGHEVDFKYTKMGAKAEIQPYITRPTSELVQPEGNLFAAMSAVEVAGLAADAVTQTADVTVVDYNDDGFADLFVHGLIQAGKVKNRLLLGQSGGGFKLEPEHPFADIERINAVLWGDINNDGLIDAYLCRQGENQLWYQSKSGQWENRTSPVTANANQDTQGGALFDADHDGDLDIFLNNRNAGNELLNNNLNGTFKPLAKMLDIAGQGSAGAIISSDLDADRDLDLIIINEHGAHEVYSNDMLWNYRAAVGFDTFKNTPIKALLAQDRNADGVPELYSLGPTGQIAIWRPDDAGIWQAKWLEPIDSKFALGANAAMALIDVDGDGMTELLQSTANGWVVNDIQDDKLTPQYQSQQDGLWRWLPFIGDIKLGPAIIALMSNGQLQTWLPGLGRHQFMGLQFSGLEDKAESMRSNASGIGTQVAIRVAKQWTVLDTLGQYSSAGQSHQALAIGLGGAAQADYIAIQWSDGVYQTELGLESGKLHHISETQRQLSSCPVLFAWDGERYQFISDILGVGGIGFALGRGEYAPSRPWENFLLPAGMLNPRDGRYLLKLGEPFEEVLYLDHVQLVAYDLPPAWQMVLDERMSINGPEPSGEAVFFRREVLPEKVLDRNGNDVTELVTQVDRQAPEVGHLDRRFIGRLEQEQQLLLEFSAALTKGDEKPLLLIDGWVEYPYSQTMFAAWQAGANYQAPSLDYRGADGKWHTLLEQFGYPAGMPRRMSVPLAGLPKGVRQLRLRTNQEIYWDRISVAYSEPLERLKRQSLPLLTADIRANGFPLRSTGKQRLPDYDYQRLQPLWDTRHLTGFYTELGDAMPLLQAHDDALAVIGPGEEVHLEFAAKMPPLQKGWSRHYVFESKGWAKDMDLFTRDGKSVGPMPTSAKPEGPRDALHARYNTRFRSGKP